MWCYIPQPTIWYDELSGIHKYQAGLIVTKCWKCTNKEKLYNELGWESLAQRQIFRRFALYFKIQNNETPIYLKEHIHPLPVKRTIRYERSFFPFCQLNWVNIDTEIRNSQTVEQFKTKYLKEIRPPKKAISVFRIDMVSVSFWNYESILVICVNIALITTLTVYRQLVNAK